MKKIFLVGVMAVAVCFSVCCGIFLLNPHTGTESKEPALTTKPGLIAEMPEGTLEGTFAAEEDGYETERDTPVDVDKIKDPTEEIPTSTTQEENVGEDNETERDVPVSDTEGTEQTGKGTDEICDAVEEEDNESEDLNETETEKPATEQTQLDTTESDNEVERD